MAQAEWNVHGVKVQVTGSVGFLEFIGNDFFQFSDDSATAGLPALFVVVGGETPDTKAFVGALVSAKTWITQDEVYHVTNCGLMIHVRLEKDFFHIQCFIPRSTLRHEEDRISAYQRILRWSIQWPLIWILENYGPWFFIHGTALQRGNRIIILSGDSGAGKSSLASIFHSEGMGKIVADNFVGVSREGVIGLPETHRLASNTYTTRRSRPKCRTTLGKDHFHLDPLHQPNEVVAVAFMGQAREAQVRRISAEMAVDHHLSIRSKSSEFPEAGFLFTLPLLDQFPRPPKVKPNMPDLGSSNIPHYFVAYQYPQASKWALSWLNANF